MGFWEVAGCAVYVLSSLLGGALYLGYTQDESELWSGRAARWVLFAMIVLMGLPVILLAFSWYTVRDISKWAYKQGAKLKEE